MNPYTPLPFADIESLHKELGGGMSLADFAKLANRATNSNMFDQAVGNPFSIGIKQASSGIDRFLDEYAGPVNETLGDAGAWLFPKFGGSEEMGRQVGEDTLRNVIDFLPAGIGYGLAAIPGVGAISIPAGLSASAALSGANAYEKTDSELMGLTSAALAGFGGKLTEFGATTALRGAAKMPVLKKLGIDGGAKQLVQQGDEVIEQLVAKKVGDRVLGAVAGESFVNVTGLLTEAGVGLAETGEWNNPFTVDNVLADMLDPTVLFGVHELVSPSVISQKVVQHSDTLKQFSSADIEDSARTQSGIVPDALGQTASEIESTYRNLKVQARKIQDEKQQKATLLQLDKARDEARKQTADLNPEGVQTLFGEALVTKLDEELFTPKTVEVTDEAGNVVQKEVTLESILSPEELISYNENLRDILSPQSMIRLAELSEMDTPKTQDEYRSTMVQMNAVRAELDYPSVDDAWLQRKIAEKTDEGDTADVAAEKAWQVAKNETEAAAESQKRLRLFTVQNPGARAGFDFSRVGQNEQGNAALGPGVYFADDPNLVRNAYGDRGEFYSASTAEDTFFVDILSTDAKHWQQVRPKLDAMAQELGYTGYSEIPQAGVSGLKDGRGPIGAFVKLLGKEKARELALKHGIHGQREQLPGGAYEYAIYDESRIRYSKPPRGADTPDVISLSSQTDEAPPTPTPSAKPKHVRKPKAADAPSKTETDPDIVKAKEAEEDADEEGWTPTDWSKLPSVREVPNSSAGIVGKLKAKDEAMKRPKGKRVNPLLTAPDAPETRESKQRELNRELNRLMGLDPDDEGISFFGELKDKGKEKREQYPKQWRFPTRLDEFEKQTELELGRLKKEGRIVEGEAPKVVELVDGPIVEAGEYIVKDPFDDGEGVLTLKEPRRGIFVDAKGRSKEVTAFNNPQYFYGRRTKPEVQLGKRQVIAPNGQPSALYESLSKWADNEDEALRLYAGVHTPRFKEWFGDWESVKREVRKTTLSYDEVTQRLDEADVSHELITDEPNDPWLSITHEYGSSDIRIKNGQIDLKQLKNALTDVDSFKSEDIQSLEALFPELSAAEKQSTANTLSDYGYNMDDQFFYLPDGNSEAIISLLPDVVDGSTGDYRARVYDRNEMVSFEHVANTREEASAALLKELDKNYPLPTVVDLEADIERFENATWGVDAMVRVFNDALSRFYNRELPEDMRLSVTYKDIGDKQKVIFSQENLGTLEGYAPTGLKNSMPIHVFEVIVNEIAPKLRAEFPSLVRLDNLRQDLEKAKVRQARTNDVSQVVDENGEPLVLFRGGTYFKEELNPDELGWNTNVPSARMGWFFSNKFENSETYVKPGRMEIDTDSPLSFDELSQMETLVKNADLDDLSHMLSRVYFSTYQLVEYVNDYGLTFDPKELKKIKLVDQQNLPEVPKSYKDDVTPVVYRDENGDYGAWSGGYSISSERFPTFEEAQTYATAFRVVGGERIDQFFSRKDLETLSFAYLGHTRAEKAISLVDNLVPFGDTNPLKQRRQAVHPQGEVMPFFLNIRKLATESDHGKSYHEEYYSTRMKRAFGSGNDGLVIRDTYDPKLNDVWIVPKGSEHQIKHAVSNSGTFGRDGKFAEFVDDVAEAEFEAERVKTRDEFMERTLRKQGELSNQAIAKSKETLTKLFDMFDGDDVQLFEILDGSVRGAATTKGSVRKLFLGDKGLEGLSDADRLFAQSFVLAHELGHNSQQLYNEGLLSQRHWDMMDRNKQWIENASVEDRKLALEIMRDGMVNSKHRESEVVQLAMNALDDPKEVQANLMAMWAMGQLEKPDSVAMNLLPTPIRKGLEVLTDIYRAVVSSLRGLSSIDFMFKKRQETRTQLDQLSKMMKTWKKELNKAQDFHTEAKGILNVGPASYTDTLAYFGKKGDIDRNSVLPNDTRGTLTRTFDEWIVPFDQLTAMVPQFRGIAADLHNYTGDTRAALNRIAGMIAGEVTADGKITFRNRTVAMEWKQVKDSPALNKIASNWMRAQQTADSPTGGKGRKISFDELQQLAPEVHKSLMGLQDKQRKAVINVVHRMGKAMGKLQDEVLNVVKASNQSMVMSYIANKVPEIRKDAPGLAQLINRALRDMKSTDPMTAQAAQVMLSQAATKLGPDLFYKTYDIAAKAEDSFTTLEAALRSSPHFFSEMRFGKHFLHWTRPDGTSGGLAFDSLNDARAKEKQLKDSGASVTREDTTRGSARVVGRDQLLDRLEEFDERGKALVDVLDLDDKTKQILKTEFNSRWEFLRDVNAAKIVEPGSKRHFAEGREDLDMIQTQMLYFQVAMRSLNKKLLNHRLNYRFSDPEMNDPQVLAMRPQLDRMIKNFFTPDTEVGRGISTFNAGYFLGGNLASHMIELMQPGFSFVPELVARNVGFVEAQKMTLKAMMEVGMFTMKHIPSAFGRMVKRHLPEGRNASQMILEGRDDNTLWDNAEYSQLMDYAAARGKISLGHASDTMDVDVENNVDITGMLGKGKGDQHPFKKYGVSPVMNFVRFPLKFYQQFTEFNARVSLILGYELAKKKPGITRQRAVEEAMEFSTLVTFSGGKLNRPDQLFGGEGTFRTAGQAMYSLQGYTFGMLGMMRRYAETGYSSKQFPGITSEQRKAARKGLITMLSTQFLGAGALGMPFMQATLLMLENLTGIEFEREMREGLAELFEEDEEEDEGLLSDAVMHGAANAILGKMLPGDPDLGSRFAIGGVMGINSYSGYSLDQLFGPTGSVVKNILTGTKEVVQGKPMQGLIDMAPISLKRALDIYKNDGELRDRNGQLLIDATYGEKIANAVGFSPQRVKKMRNNERLQARHEEKVRQDMIRQMDNLAELYMENPAAVANEVHQIAVNEPQVALAREMGNMQRAQVELIASKRAAAAKIADRLEKRMFPKDPGSAGTLRGTYGEAVGVGQVTETAKLQLKAQVEQTIGLKPSLTERAVRRAAIIDRLIQQNPTLGRPEAAAKADLLLSRA